MMQDCKEFVGLSISGILPHTFDLACISVFLPYVDLAIAIEQRREVGGTTITIVEDNSPASLTSCRWSHCADLGGGVGIDKGG